MRNSNIFYVPKRKQLITLTTVGNKSHDSLNLEYLGFKEKLSEIKQTQIDYYYLILKEGSDARELGIVWAVNFLRILGEEVKISMMPKFLDPACIKFLFKLSKMHEDLENLKRDLKK